MATDLPARVSRRAAVRTAALGAGAIALAGPARAVAQDSGEDPSDVIFEAIEISYALVLAYEPAASFNGEPAAESETLARFGAQSSAHADALENAFELTSAEDPPEIPTSVGESELLEDLPATPTREEFLDRLLELEGQLITLLLENAADLESPSLVRSFGEIAANAAQHQVVIRQIQLGASAPPAKIVPEAIITPVPDTASTPPEDSASEDSGS